MATIKHQYYDENWSLYDLTNYGTRPYMEPIMRIIEPKIVRGAFLPCWKWLGSFQRYNKTTIRQTIYPIVSMPINIHNPKGPKRMVYVHRFLAQTFWEMGPQEIVYRKCESADCVNPAHFVISHRNDTEFS